MRFDPGLQPERTALAWNRTALSLVVGGVAGLRVLPMLVGGVGAVVAVVVIAAGGSLGLVAHRRSEVWFRVLLGGTGPTPDGRLLLGLSALVGLVALMALAVVVGLAVTT